MLEKLELDRANSPFFNPTMAVYCETIAVPSYFNNKKNDWKKKAEYDFVSFFSSSSFLEENK